MMLLLPLLCLLTAGHGPTSAQENRPGVVTVPEDEDAVLPCTLRPEQNINKFHWKKDNGENDKKEVFYYENGKYYGHGLNEQDQDEKFKDHVEFFKEELKHGNASIKIKNPNLNHNGTYTCVILEPEKKEFTISLNVGAAPEPIINTDLGKITRWLLECEVKGVPEPEVEWTNSAGDLLGPTEKNTRSQSGTFHVTLRLNVTKSDKYTCVATQREIYHQVNKTIPVSIPVILAVVEGKDVLLPCPPNFKHANKNLVYTWYKDDHEVKKDDQLKGRLTEAGDKHGIASKIINKTQMSDSGHYSCRISNVQKYDFILQVVEHPAQSVAATASVPTVVLIVVFGITTGVL